MVPAIDTIVPHLFCVEGTTRYRVVADMLGIELMGCSGEVCAISQDKFITKAVCKVAGVPVPGGTLLRSDLHGTDVTATAKKLLETEKIPFIVKPAKEDNSMGLSLVRNASVAEIATALSEAFKYDEHILVEEYIAGREVRVGVFEVEDGDGFRLEVTPMLEYILEDIRDMKKKLGVDANGKLLTDDSNITAAFEKGKEEGERIYPAQIAPELQKRIEDLAKNTHKAMGCKYYSLCDVRINPEGFPYMLETGLMCSWSPHSALVSLAKETTTPELRKHPVLFENFLRRAGRETRARRAAATEAKPETAGGAIKKRRLTYTN